MPVNFDTVPPRQGGCVKRERCSRCGELKSADEFYLRKDKGVTRRRVQCVECVLKVRARSYKRALDADPVGTRLRRRRRHLLEEYGLSLEVYQKMLDKQGGKCAICGYKSPDKPLSVDHDHANGKIRGLLCAWCNTTLGQVNDNVDTLRKMIKYVQHHKRKS